MSSLSTPVMVLTTNQAMPIGLDPVIMDEKELESYGPRGMTLSSVCSLSVKPLPMVCFNLQVPSRTSAAIHSRKMFALNILPPNHDSVKICRAFAGGLGKDINPFKAEEEYLTTIDKNVGKLSDEFEIGSEKFITEKASDIPTVKSAVAVMYCEAKQMFKAQDHEIWVAEIVAVRSSDRFLAPDCVGGVLYHKRAFHSVGERLKEPSIKEINDSRERGRSKLSHCIEFTDSVIY
ncbi:hypothetical protein NADFUDRAFT_30425 [Nadsonia fulvescens var. elongata DSM 6958]|uniref:Flavin reductase like domain-containing protein n=1 Tax=Nadsonia fulvescens var. elongata DSM 6958 TaxID=857566 RepID=A0A1E3PSE3_9ASCO|nr:hypothetical protein NADFUDRAFT_30425 [Nadsonia fulvescens var. elongata DSM 6958]